MDQHIHRCLQEGDATAASLRQVFRGVYDRAPLCKTVDNFFDDAAAVRTTLEALHVERTILDQLRDCINLLRFFDTTRREEDPLWHDIRSLHPFVEVRDFLDFLARAPERSPDFATLKGFLIGVSDFWEENLLQNFSQFNVFSLYGIIFDRDCHWAGKDMVILSPNWWVIGNRTISLHGEDGELHNPITAAIGTDGLPGHPGKNGGNFCGAGRTFYRAQALTINTRGGMGGRGQDGGDGANGINGHVTEMQREDVNNRKEEYRISRIRIQMPWHRERLTMNRRFQEVYCVEAPGTAGGDAGQGGVGGGGGNAGRIDLPQNARCRRIAVNGELGRGGNAGQRGQNGCSCAYEGTYINEFILARTRRIEGAPDVVAGVAIAAPGAVGIAAGVAVAVGEAVALSAAAIGGIATALVTPAAIGSHIFGSWIAARLSSRWEIEPRIIERGTALPGQNAGGLNAWGADEPDPLREIDRETANLTYQRLRTPHADQFFYGMTDLR